MNTSQYEKMFFFFPKETMKKSKNSMYMVVP